jgi:hypothetical protein
MYFLHFTLCSFLLELTVLNIKVIYNVVILGGLLVSVILLDSRFSGSDAAEGDGF